ncbi:MAG: hypothetical protein IJL71_04750, partial [Oscillospiraceae bacterium]|nr:hypothetical protein [Oscillospiraceae bacterium]
TKKLALDLSPVYDLIANVVGGPEQAVTVSQGKPLTIDKPIDLTIDLPEDFVDPDRDFVYVAQTVDGKTRIYRGELGETVDGVRKLSLRTIGLSPIEITTEDNMVAKITEDMDGVNVNLYYPTLAEAVEEVKNEGVITLVKPVTESINSIKDKVFTVELDPIVNEEEVHLTVDGKEASFTDRSLTIPVN